MFVFIVSLLLYLYLSVSLFACLYITILSVLPEWRINFIINIILVLLLLLNYLLTYNTVGLRSVYNN